MNDQGKTMAEVLLSHARGVTKLLEEPGVIITCNCGWEEFADPRASVNYADQFAAHQAEALSAAGFGLVADAKAEALEEAADHLARLEYVRPDHPNRAAYEKILAVRRGNTDAWLKARAGLIRNPS